MQPQELHEKLKKVELFVTDVDGTLTDGGMYYSANGEELKRFSTRDGMGFTLLHQAGIQTAILTSENSKIVEARADKLKIKNVFINSQNKVDDLLLLAEKLSISLENIAYIGDDVNDIEVMRLAGISACPCDAVSSIKNISGYVCKNKGGYGAVREFADLVLSAQNKLTFLKQ